MKTLLSILFLVPALALGQSFPTDQNGRIVYSAVIQADSLTIDQLLEKAVSWIESYYTSEARYDKEQDKIKLRGSFVEKGTGASYTWHYNLMLEFKEGRYKYTIDNIYYKLNAIDYSFESVAFPKTFKKFNLKRASKIEEQKLQPLIDQVAKLGTVQVEDW